MAILRYVLLGAVIAALGFQGANANEAVRIDGGETGWDEGRWYVQVDGVMGGKSSGDMQFRNNVMKFSGDINLDGGGFSSVRRGIDLDLSDYAGVVVTLEADARSAGSGSTFPPTGLHLQFDDRTSYYDFSSAFAIPLSDTSAITSIYLPMDSFDRGTRIGFTCRDGCSFDASAIRGMSVYVLFQEGSFDVRLRSIEAVTEPRSFPLPSYDVLESSNDVVGLIRSTISSGGGLYDKSYVELCVAMYWSALNTILSAAVVPEPVKAVICAGLQEVEAQMDEGDSKQNIAWTMRYAMDAVVADLQGSSRTSAQSWLPTPSEASSMEVSCEPRTSAAPGTMYDPFNEDILVSESEDEVVEEVPPVNSVIVEEEEESPSEVEEEEEEENEVSGDETDKEEPSSGGEPLSGNEEDPSSEIEIVSEVEAEGPLADLEVDEEEGVTNSTLTFDDEESSNSTLALDYETEDEEETGNSTLPFDNEGLMEDTIISKTYAYGMGDSIDLSSSSGSSIRRALGSESFVVGILLLLGTVQIV